MKYFIIFLVLLEVATLFVARQQVRASEIKYANYEQRLSNFYYGFCGDVKDSGFGWGENYHRLCEE